MHEADSFLEQVERRSKDAVLELRVVRAAERMARGKRDPQGARWLDLLHVLAHQADRCGRDARHLEDSGQHTRSVARVARRLITATAEKFSASCF
jgi:hypothetical protein